MKQRYYWRVVLRNDHMGFQRVVTPGAEDISGALTYARRYLMAAGYDPEDFEAIEVKRGTLIGNSWRQQ